VPVKKEKGTPVVKQEKEVPVKEKEAPPAK
jgi:hypothetical protein